MIQRKKIAIVLTLLVIFSMGLKPDTLIEVYKKGEILLDEDPEFGKEVDWEELFYDIAKEMAIGSDGSIYVTNGRQNNVFHFSKDGQYIKKFGQKGQGPLDFFAPGDPSILDKEWLVVNDYPLNKKISLVNLHHIDSKHTIVLKTKHDVWNVVALRENKIAYITRKDVSLSKWDKKRITPVIIKDTVTGAEKVVAEYELSYRCRSNKAKSLLRKNKYFGKVFFGNTPNGNLLAGFSARPDIHIFSPEGKELKGFKLDYKPVPISNDKREELMDRFSNAITGNTPLGKKLAADYRNAMKGAALLGDHYPYYTHLLVDTSGNVLIFTNDVECKNDCEIRFRVYSPEGRYICTTKINTGKFDFKIDDRFRNIIFTGNGIYGLFQLKNSEDISLRLVRVKVKSD